MQTRTVRSQQVAHYIYNFIAMKEFGFPLVKMAFEKGIPDYESIGLLSFFKAQIRKPDMVRLNKNNYLQILVGFLNDFGSLKKTSFKEFVLKHLFDACCEEDAKRNPDVSEDLGKVKDELSLDQAQKDEIKKEFDEGTLDLQEVIDILSEKINIKLRLEMDIVFTNIEIINDEEKSYELRNL